MTTPKMPLRCEWLARCTNRSTHWAIDTRNPMMRWACCDSCAAAPTHRTVVRHPVTRWTIA